MLSASRKGPAEDGNSETQSPRDTQRWVTGVAATEAARRASQPGASTRGARTVSRHQQCKGDGGGASKREQITTQSSGTKTEMAGMKRDREREPSRDVRQEEAKRNTERRQQERLKRQSTHGELQKNRERQKGHRENKKRKGETDAEKLLDVR